MPTRNNPQWSYDHFVEVASQEALQGARLHQAIRESHEDERSRRNVGSPFHRTPAQVVAGIRFLADAEQATRSNVSLAGTFIESRRGYSTGHADYLANRKGVYQFIKDAPPRLDREAAIRNYTAMRALRLQASGISRAARMYGAGRLAEQACETVKAFREEYRQAMAFRPCGYTVVRWFENRKIEFHLPPAYGARRLDHWRETVGKFREAIQRARAERRANIGDVLAQKPTNIHLQKNAIKLLRVYKKPDENVRSVGIEIECYIPRNADMTKLYPVAQYVNITQDGSIHPEGENMAGVEFRVCTPAFKMADVMTQLCAILKDMGAKVNTSCGLHVHLDQRNRTPEEVQQTFSNFIRAQNLLLEVVPKSRRNNTYCKKHRGTDFHAAIRGGRYKIVNAQAYGKHKTLEIRLFNGTVNATKIIHWVKTLWAIESGQPVLRCPKTFDIAQRYWRIDPSTLAWLKKRQEKFKAVTADNTDVMDAEPIEEN